MIVFYPTDKKCLSNWQSLPNLALTDEVFSFPFVRFVVDRDFESSVAVMPEPGLYADGAVDVNHSAHDGLGIETTSDPVIRVETRTGNVDDGTT